MCRFSNKCINTITSLVFIYLWTLTTYLSIYPYFAAVQNFHSFIRTVYVVCILPPNNPFLPLRLSRPPSSRPPSPVSWWRRWWLWWWWSLVWSLSLPLPLRVDNLRQFCRRHADKCTHMRQTCTTFAACLWSSATVVWGKCVFEYWWIFIVTFYAKRHQRFLGRLGICVIVSLLFFFIFFHW